MFNLIKGKAMKKRGRKIIFALFLYIVAIIIPHISENLEIVSNIVFIFSYLIVRIRYFKESAKKYFKR